MKFLLSLFVFLLSGTPQLKAQQYYFVYIQTENKQPFYVNIDGKLLSSSNSGYVVIPKLTDGQYPITVGFPKNQWPQQSLQLDIHNADAGFILKNFNEKGWGLFNVQNSQVSMSTSSVQPAVIVDDEFNKVLSKATNITTPKIVSINKPETISKIEKINSMKSTNGYSYIYVDIVDDVKDTVNVFIQNSNVETDQQQKNSKEPIVTNQSEPIIEEKKFIDVDLQKPNTNAISPITLPKVISPIIKKSDNEVVVNNAVVSFNSDCKRNAENDDFLKIRKKMADESTDDDMIIAAKKFYKTTCFSVEQIKNLSVLFLNDAGKYKFFDASYPHIYDSQNFSTLQMQLNEEYFINRFKAMLHN